MMPYDPTLMLYLHHAREREILREAAFLAVVKQQRKVSRLRWFSTMAAKWRLRWRARCRNLARREVLTSWNRQLCDILERTHGL